MLEQGKWYRNPSGGVMLVERLGLSGATVKIVTGKVVDSEFTTKEGQEVSFSSFETKRIEISAGAAVEEATPEEVERFVRRKKTITITKEESMNQTTMEPEVEKVDMAALAEPKPARVRREAQHEIELDPPATARKKLNPCSYSTKGERCNQPAPYRLYWIYRDGEKVQKSFCRACLSHAKPFAEKHGAVLPDRPRRK